MELPYGLFVLFILIGIVGSIGTLVGVLWYFLKEWKSQTLW